VPRADTHTPGKSRLNEPSTPKFAQSDTIQAGLAFVGLPFQYAVASPTLMGMGRDAQYVVDRLLAIDRVTAPLAGR
jgi:hypothetical protein